MGSDVVGTHTYHPRWRDACADVWLPLKCEEVDAEGAGIAAATKRLQVGLPGMPPVAPVAAAFPHRMLSRSRSVTPTPLRGAESPLL